MISGTTIFEGNLNRTLRHTHTASPALVQLTLMEGWQDFRDGGLGRR